MRRLAFLSLMLAAGAIGAAPGDAKLFPSIADIEPKAKAAPAAAAAPKSVKIVGAATPVPAGGFADLSVEAGKSASVTWRISPAPVQRAKDLPTSRLIFGGKAGATYSVTAFVVDFDAKTVADSETEVVFAGAPNPQPHPEPQPKPEPSPVGTVSSFVVVEDTLKAGPWRGEILGSPKVEAWYRQLQGARTGAIHLLVDANAPTAAGKKWAEKAAGKKLPYLFLLDAGGAVVKECEAPIASPDAFVAAFDLQAAGERSMGLIMEAPKLKWVEFGSTVQTPIIPRAQWKPIKFTAFLPPVYDQDGVGQCASSACCTTIETAARMAGTPIPKLSAGDLYSRVNGGRDRGSLLEDNLDEAGKGVALASRVPYIWNGRKANDAATVAERARFRIVEAYWCKDFDAMASAIQQGFIVEHGLMWHNNFKPDADGWLPAKGVGGGGGHALCGYGLVERNGVYGIATRNSWGSGWGRGGDCVIPESLFGSNIGGFFAVRVVTSGEPVTVRRDPFNLREFALAW